MKHKTLFRLALKVIGVWFLVSGTTSLIASIIYLIYAFLNPQSFGSTPMLWYYFAQLIGPLSQLAIGGYLLFGGRWIADMAIPGNKSYCHECGYDLTGAVGNVCVECGTPFRAVSEVSNEPRAQTPA